MGSLRIAYPQNPEEMEAALGLSRGDILEVESVGNRTVRVTLRPGMVLPNALLQQRLERVTGGVVSVE